MSIGARIECPSLALPVIAAAEFAAVDVFPTIQNERWNIRYAWSE